MNRTFGTRRRAGALLVVLSVLGALLVGTGSAGGAGSVRGFDGTTIKVASIGIKGQLPLAELGAQARIKRFNDTNEIKGIKMQYAGFADDKQDSATALSESRRLVTQEGVFAIVGDVSANNPADYFVQQQVPYFGGGFDHTYCSSKPTTSEWGFAFAGCLTSDNPSWVGDLGKAPYTYVSKKTRKAHPTAVVFGADTDAGKRGDQNFAIAYQGAGFKVVAVQSTVPQPSPADYTPYVQQMLTADSGHAPDTIFCQMQIDCIGIYTLLRANGFEGVYIHGLLAIQVVKPFNGSVAFGPYVNLTENTLGLRRMKADMDAFDAGSSSQIDFGSLAGYTSTDMFIQVLKKVAAKGKSNITPANVQKVASKMTFKLDGIYGPTEYPKTTVYSYPACLSLSESDGTNWTTVEPLTCSTKKFSPTTKLG